MNSLPENKGLDIAALSRAFENTSNSYKFYWFLSLLDHLCNLQYDAFYFHLQQGNHKIIEDFNIMLSHRDYKLMSREHFVEKLSQEINNNSRIAVNIGFKSSYVYR